MKTWSDNIDPATIPDQVLKSERARRNNALRTGKYTGGKYWKEHNPDTPRCRCHECMDQREKVREKKARAKARKQAKEPELGETKQARETLQAFTKVLARKARVPLAPPMKHRTGRPRKSAV